MCSRVLAIWGLLFLEVSSALYPSYFNLEEPDYSYSLYQDIIDIFRESPNIPQAIVLVSDNFEEFNLPIKRLHEEGVAVVIGENEPMFVHSSFVEINCGQCRPGGILDDILPRVIDSHTIVVILKNSQDLSFTEIEACMLEVFEEFWKQLITNVVIMFSSNYGILVKGTSTHLKTFAYVYEPYNEEPLRNVTGLSYRKIFYDKTANLHLHPIKVLAHERNRFAFYVEDGIPQLSGIDGSLTKILNQIFNATVILSFLIDSGAGMRDRDLREHREQLRNGSFDIWMNVRIIHPEVYQGVTHSYPRERMDIICILSKDGDGHIKYRNIIGGRVLYLLLAMVTVFSVVSLLMFLINKILLQNVPILKLAKVVWNQSDAVTQKMSSTTMRVLFGSWIAGSLVWSTSLQTFITARIIRPSVEDRMMTIRDVIQSGTYLRIEQTQWTITKNHYDEGLLTAMQDNIVVVADGNLFDVQAPDVGYLASRDSMEFVSKKSRTYVLREIFLPTFAAYYFSEKAPFLYKFNKALAAITETGITQKWVADNHYRLKIESKIEKPVNPVKYITYKHLKSVVYVYVTGMLIALAVFICEVKFQ